MYTISVNLFHKWTVGVFNLSFRQPSFKLQQTAKTKDEWTVQFECMHGVVGPKSLVEGQHVWSYRA